MRTRSGLIELEAGFTLGLAAVGPDQVRVCIQYDPDHKVPLIGVRVCQLTRSETVELVQLGIQVLEREAAYRNLRVVRGGRRWQHVNGGVDHGSAVE